MMNMADLNSFSPIRHPPPSKQRGILTNKTNTANQYQPQLNFPTPQTSAPSQQQPQAAINQYQPPKYVPPKPSQPPPPTAPATNQKRSNSVQSQKSIGDAAANNGEKRDINPPLRENSRKTTVAFGLTTKVDETLKGIRQTPVPYKHPIGSTKDIMDLRKTVEHQSTILQSQHEEIQQLKATIEVQKEKYIYLLDSNTKLYERLGNLEKQISSSTPNNIKFNHVMANEKTNEENVVCIEKNVPKDSIVMKKGSGETGKPKRANDERQLVPAQPIKHASEMDAVSEVQRFLNANPNDAKNIEMFAKTVQQKQQKSQSENEESEEENDRKKMEKRDHRHGHHHRHKNNNDNGMVEEFTIKRKIYKQNNIHQLSSTIDDSLRKFGSMFYDNKHNNHHQRNRRRSPTTPTIREVSSSAASSSSSFESDEFVEEPRQQRSLDKRRNGRKNNSDNQQFSSIEATNMPDHFDDDDDMSSDPETPPRREHPRQRVADRFENRRP